MNISALTSLNESPSGFPTIQGTSMNMYKTMQKHQNTFFTSAEDVLSFCKEIEIKQNNAGLYYLTVNGSFKASFKENEKNDAILFYGNQLIQRRLSK